MTGHCFQTHHDLVRPRYLRKHKNTTLTQYNIHEPHEVQASLVNQALFIEAGPRD